MGLSDEFVRCSSKDLVNFKNCYVEVICFLQEDSEDMNLSSDAKKMILGLVDSLEKIVGVIDEELVKRRS